ncbi:hypothetical protein GUJ93_ZPchr0001g32706 [Zizania palustris]|uniref:Uncharacterized protein n=1 Tax=Zizania palustris TaxID=103762 RepID=A0A8J5S5U6_ZIZPA|nr:hypothetical protein GUJ93_ZPchr0001g32706 [Zizania palustris]
MSEPNGSLLSRHSAALLLPESGEFFLSSLLFLPQARSTGVAARARPQPALCPPPAARGRLRSPPARGRPRVAGCGLLRPRVAARAWPAAACCARAWPPARGRLRPAAPAAAPARGRPRVAGCACCCARAWPPAPTAGRLRVAWLRASGEEHKKENLKNWTICLKMDEINQLRMRVGHHQVINHQRELRRMTV